MQSPRVRHLPIAVAALLAALVSSTAFAAVNPAKATFDSAGGTLAISASAESEVRCASDTRGFLVLSGEGWERSGNPASAHFDAALQAVSATTLHRLKLEGEGRFFVGDLTVAGDLAVEAPQLTLTGHLHAQNLRLLAASGLVVEASAHVSAQMKTDGGQILCEAPSVITGGTWDVSGEHGGVLRFSVKHMHQYGLLQADGNGDAGSIEISFTGRYTESEGGRLMARSTQGRGGRVILLGGSEGSVYTSGGIHVTGLQGGTVHILGSDLKLAASNIDASGDYAGGTILIGGDKQGANPAIANARSVMVGGTVQVVADARINGPGGKIIVWSDGNTTSAPLLSARGGPVGGDGGFLESSAKGQLAFGGHADAAAPHGKPGTLLLDPKFIEIKTSGGGPVIGFSELINPHPSPSPNGNFGVRTAALSNGKVVVVAPGDDTNGTSSGAAHLYNGATGALVSSVFGAAAFDGLGGYDAGQGQMFTQIIAAEIINVGANAWIISQESGGHKGSLTYINGTTGTSGVLSSANSILGVVAHMFPGGTPEFAATNFFATPPSALKLSTGAYVMNAPYYNALRGFSMFLDPVTGLPPGLLAVAQPSVSNCLLGSNASDLVGSTCTDLKNGHYLVHSNSWSGGPAASGATSFCDSTTATVGAVTKTNSMVGPTVNDNFGGQVFVLPNQNYVLVSPSFGQGAGFGVPKGAVTFCLGTTGRPAVGTADGSVDATNTYMGNAGDQIATNPIGGSAITVLSNGYYVIASPTWGTNRGAVAVGSPTVGVVGLASAANSLVGHTSGNGNSTFGDSVGSGSNFTLNGGVTPVGNGNFVVASPSFNGFRGAVTWMDPHTPLVGDVISSSNSLVGTGGVVAGQSDAGFTGDRLGLGGVFSSQSYQVFSGGPSTSTLTYTLTNGNYVVLSPAWSGGGDGGFSANGKGAATFGNGNTGIVGNVTSGNSIVGATSGAGTGDSVGSVNGITILSNGNYMLHTKSFNGGRGAITWCNGATGTFGVLDATNSLVGTTAFQSVADGNNAYAALSNGNYLVGMPAYNSNAGAVFWGDGSTAGTRLVGTIDAASKITGATANDNVGQTIRLLTNGNAYVVSTNFNNGATGAGAVTWINGANGHDVAGGFNAVSATNSLVGGSMNDNIGSGLSGGVALANGNFIVGSPNWDSGGTTDVGALTFCKGDGTTVGVVGPGNSLVGSNQNDHIGSSNLIVVLPSGNWVVGHNSYNGFAGEVTWGSGTTGVKGVISSSNSIIGFSDHMTIQDQLGSFIIATPGNGNSFNDNPRITASGDFVIITPNFHVGANAVGAATFVNGSTGQTLNSNNTISSANSLIGTNASGGQSMGSIEDHSNGNLLVSFPLDGAGRVRLFTGVGTPSSLFYADQPGASVTMDPTVVASAIGGGTNVVLQANTDLTVTDPVTVVGSGAGTLTLQAGRSILVNASITTNNGPVNLTANDVLAAGVVDGQRDSGAGLMTMAAGTTIDAGTGAFTAKVLDGAGKTNTTSGLMSLATIKAHGGTLTNSGLSAGSNISVTSLQITGNMTASAPTVTLKTVDLGKNLLTVTGNLAFAASGQFTTQIGGTAAGQLGQTAVSGSVSLNNAVLNASLVGGFSPAPGTVVTLVDHNDGGGSIPDTFSGFAQGSTANVSGTDFTVSYTAGGGANNDAALIAAVPFTPSITATTTLEDFQSSAGLVITPNAGDGGATTNYQITAITGGTLFKNDGVTPITLGGFITKLEGSAGLKFTPGANLYTPASAFGFSVQAAVGTNPATDLKGGVVPAAITVNPVADTPSVTNASTPMNTQSTSGLVISRNAADGTEVTNFKITNILNGTLFKNNGSSAINAGDFITFAEGNAGLKFTPTNGFTGQGHFDVQASLSATNAGLGGGTATATITVGTLNPTPTEVGNTATLNRQNGLYTLTVNVQNTTGAAINGFRLNVNYSAYLAQYPSLKLFNASSPVASPTVWVDYPFPVAPNAVVAMSLDFFTSNRLFPSPFTPVFTVTSLGSEASQGLTGVHITNITKLPDNTYLLEWNTIPGHWYRVSFSSDMTTWLDSPTPLQAGATKMQWNDTGPPFTDVSPATVMARFYTVKEIPTP